LAISALAASRIAAGGAVVLLQPEQLCLRQILAELVQVLDPRAAPAVDRLIVVADHERVRPRPPDQQPDPGVLDRIGVLELIDQHVPEARR
jgi:hypothetical protein